MCDHFNASTYKNLIMMIGYAKVPEVDSPQLLAFQTDALIEAGVPEDRIYFDFVSEETSKQPALDACLRELQPGNTLVVWKLDCLGKDPEDLIKKVDELRQRQVSVKVIAGSGAGIDTATANGRLFFMFLQEFQTSMAPESPKPMPFKHEIQSEYADLYAVVR